MPSATPTPFVIDVPQGALDALKQRLASTTLPPPPPPTDDPWHYGVPNADIKRILAHWKTAYDWRAAEASLNKDLPQFTLPVAVQDHGILTAHFVHRKATRHDAIPLLFLHGWPGHFAEVRKVLPLLTNPEGEDDPAFHVVAPSLPGFGFSSAPEKSGFALSQYAEFAHNLMLALGYDRYVVQGGDWGFFIGHRVVHLYGPEHARAWHTNFPVARPPTFSSWPRLYIANMLTPLSEEEKKGLQRTQWLQEHGFAYYLLQATTPQTLAYSLADSPVGLLAWIYERLVVWTDNYPWTDDEILTWIHIYLLGSTISTSSAATSVRIYAERAHAGDTAALDDPSQYNGAVPLGISIFPQELAVVPAVWHHTLGNIVYSNRHSSGGHFAAHERPMELVADIRKMFKLPEVRKKL